MIPGLSSNKCKTIAMLSMLIDHTGAIFFPSVSILRYLGRPAFPIFIFLLIEGFTHTKSRTRYLVRLLLFAFISEIPFDLALYGQPFYNSKCNVFFTLTIGLLSIHFFDIVYDSYLDSFLSWIKAGACILIITGCFYLADFMHTDYGASGVLAIVTGFALHKLNLHRCIVITGIIIILALNHHIEIAAFLALPAIFLYNGRRGLDSVLLKWCYYIFYPAHLLALHYISTIITTPYNQ